MAISLHDEFANLNLYIKYEPRTIYEKVSYSKIDNDYKDVDGNKFIDTHKDLIIFIDNLPYDKPKIDIQPDEIFKYDHLPKAISTNPQAPPPPTPPPSTQPPSTQPPSTNPPPPTPPPSTNPSLLVAKLITTFETLKVLTYNISWEAMTANSKSGNPFTGTAKNVATLCHNKTNTSKDDKQNICLQNVAEVIEKTPDLDFVGLQEASNYKLIIDKSPQLKKMKYIHHNLPGIPVNSRAEDIVSFYNQTKFKFVVAYIGAVDNRPYQIIYLKHRKSQEQYAFINVHLPHKDVKTNILNGFQYTTGNIYKLMDDNRDAGNASNLRIPGEIDAKIYHDNINPVLKMKNIEYKLNANFNEIYNTKHIIFLGDTNDDKGTLYNNLIPFNNIDKNRVAVNFQTVATTFKELKVSNKGVKLPKTCCNSIASINQKYIEGNNIYDKNGDYILISDELNYVVNKANIIPPFLSSKKDFNSYPTSDHLPVYSEIIIPGGTVKIAAHAGLINGCNKCFMNSAIQLLGYMDDLMTKLTSYKINNADADKNNKQNVQDFFKDLISGNKAILNYGITDDKQTETPDINNYFNLYKVFYKKTFNKEPFGVEEDAGEFLRYLLEYFTEIPTILGNGSSQYTKNGFGLDNKSFIFETTEQTTCTDGLKVGEKNITQKYTNSMLNLPIIDVKKLVDAIKNYQSKEKLEPANYLTKCVDNNNRVALTGPATKTLTIKIPKENKYLIIQFLLFNNTLEKIKKKINIENILLIDGKNYNLSGFIVHIGATMVNGHYVFYKVLADGSGILYDDDNVSYTDKKTIDTFLNKNSAVLPYILLYEWI